MRKAMRTHFLLEKSIRKPHVAVFSSFFEESISYLLDLTLSLAVRDRSVTFSFFCKSSFIPEKEDIKLPSNVIIYPVLDCSCNNFQRFLQMSQTRIEEVIHSRFLKITSVLSDYTLSFAQEISLKLMAQLVFVWTASSYSLLLNILSDEISKSIPRDKNNPEIKNMVIEAVKPLRLADIFFLLCGPDNRHKIIKPQFGILLINTADAAEIVASNRLKNMFSRILTIPRTIITSRQDFTDFRDIWWLDAQADRSVVYTSIYLSNKLSTLPFEVEALAEAIVLSGYPFFWCINKNNLHLLPCSLKNIVGIRGKICFSRCDQAMRHRAIGSIVTDCEWSNVLTAITYKIPLICRPTYGEQLMYARIVVEAWGVGVLIEGDLLKARFVLKSLRIIMEKGRVGNYIRRNLHTLQGTLIKIGRINLLRLLDLLSNPLL